MMEEIPQSLLRQNSFLEDSFLDKNCLPILPSQKSDLPIKIETMTFYTEYNDKIDGRTFQYSLMGEKWLGSLPTIIWSFAENNAYDLSLSRSYSGYPNFEAGFDATQKQLVRSAFQAWEDAANIDFVERADSFAAQVRINWDSIDGHSLNGGTLGQTIVWSTNNVFTQAAIQIDSADIPEAYFGTDSPPSGKWSFFATVAHEIGHALGLDHSSSSSALMYYRAGTVVDLTADDIAGLVAIYGRPRKVSQSVKDLPSLAKGIDPTMYLAANQDVAYAGIDPVTHFNAFGWREGRNPNNFFDVQFYLGANPDVNAAGVNPLDHYLQFGWKESRNPSDNFSTTGYLDANPDVKLVGISPLLHYLMFGYGEGRFLA